MFLYLFLFLSFYVFSVKSNPFGLKNEELLSFSPKGVQRERGFAPFAFLLFYLK